MSEILKSLFGGGGSTVVSDRGAFVRRSDHTKPRSKAPTQTSAAKRPPAKSSTGSAAPRRSPASITSRGTTSVFLPEILARTEVGGSESSANQRDVMLETYDYYQFDRVLRHKSGPGVKGTFTAFEDPTIRRGREITSEMECVILWKDGQEILAAKLPADHERWALYVRGESDGGSGFSAQKSHHSSRSKVSRGRQAGSRAGSQSGGGGSAAGSHASTMRRGPGGSVAGSYQSGSVITAVRTPMVQGQGDGWEQETVDPRDSISQATSAPDRRGRR